ncbi:hypothetical protein AVEN_85666-1, partial [Araneus ventricosus]
WSLIKWSSGSASGLVVDEYELEEVYGFYPLAVPLTSLIQKLVGRYMVYYRIAICGHAICRKFFWLFFKRNTTVGQLRLKYPPRRQPVPYIGPKSSSGAFIQGAPARSDQRKKPHLPLP